MALGIGAMLALSAITGGIGYASQNQTNKQQNRGALSRQQLADANNQKFWQMQNAYNDPSAQMARFKQAGLNPALIYGAKANAGNAGPIAPSKPAPYNVKNPLDPNAMLIMAQLAQTTAQTQKIKAETNNINSLIGSQVAQAKSDADISFEKAKQEAVRSGEISKQQEAITTSLENKALKDIAERKFTEAYTTFKLGLIKANIDPTGNIGTTAMKWLVTSIQKARESIIPSEQSFTDKTLKALENARNKTNK